MFLIGAGGHARVVYEILAACKRAVNKISDRNPNITEFLGIPVVHSEDPCGEETLITIGDNAVRRKVVERLLGEDGDCRFGRAIHPSAIVSESAEIGEGTVVMQGAIIQAGAKIGKHCIINTGAVVDHECELDDYVHVSPNATLCGQVKVGEGAWIGAGATVIQCRSIGEWTVIGAGSVVVDDIPAHVKAFGNKCRPF